MPEGQQFKEQTVQVLAFHFSREAETRPLLETAGVPPDKVLSWGNLSAWDYWWNCLSSVEGGVIPPAHLESCPLPDGIAAILLAALKRLPGNNDLQALLELRAKHLGLAWKATVSVRSRSGSLSPQPNYRDELTRALGEQLAQLIEKECLLRAEGASQEAIQEVVTAALEVKRRLRDGPELQAGEWLSNRYQLIKKLGSGGFATVWQAFDKQVKHLVAVKILHGQHGDSAERLARFHRGARVMQKLMHPNIVRILGDLHQQDGGYHYFVMEYIGGGTFYQAVTTGNLTLEKRIQVLREMSDALGFAHEQGIIHRDVTPDNILLDAPTGVARLADFDLVRLPDSTGGTRTGALGKFVYAAPECMESANDVDERCDIYSLGMTAVFAFHGKKLPPTALMNRSQFLESLNCPPKVKAVLDRATDPQRDERFSTMEEFGAALGEALVNPRPVPGSTPGPKNRGTVPPKADTVLAQTGGSLFWSGVVTGMDTIAPGFGLVSEAAPADTAAGGPADEERRRHKLTVLSEQVAGCRRCAELWSTRTQTVFGVGPLNPDLCFVGEAPGADEDRTGEPFVGAAGRLLNRIITACGLRREEVYILNILKCRPPGNCQPKPDEAHHCQGYLEKQIELIGPKFMCALGKSAVMYLLGTQVGITRLRGRFLEYRGIPVMCTFHPSYLLRTPEAKKDVWEDMKKLLTRMGRPIPGKSD
jgi:uracil-DNA glycosylase family 4